MSDNYNNSYQMNAIRQSCTMLKFKRINIVLDDDWIVCECINTIKINTISNKTITSFREETNVKQKPIHQDYIYNNINMGIRNTNTNPIKPMSQKTFAFNKS